MVQDERQGNFYEKNEGKHFKRCKKSGEDTTNSSYETTSPTTNSSNETTSATNNASNETTSVTNTTTARPNDTYVYGVGILAVPAIGVCVFFANNTFQPKNNNTSQRKTRSTTKFTSYALDLI